MSIITRMQIYTQQTSLLVLWRKTKDNAVREQIRLVDCSYGIVHIIEREWHLTDVSHPNKVLFDILTNVNRCHRCFHKLLSKMTLVFIQFLVELLFCFIFVIYDQWSNCKEEKRKPDADNREREREQKPEEVQTKTKWRQRIFICIYTHICFLRDRSSKFASIGIEWCSVQWGDQRIRIGRWRSRRGWSAELLLMLMLLRTVEWGGTGSVGSGCHWMHSHRGWIRRRWDRRGIDIEARILFLPFRASILEPNDIDEQATVSCWFNRQSIESYQIFTCVSVSDNERARFNRSQTDKYLVCLNLFSNATNCSYVNAVRARRGFDGRSVVDEVVEEDFDLSPSLTDTFKSSSCALSPASDRHPSGEGQRKRSVS